MKIEDLGLSVRAYHAVCRAGIKTVQELYNNYHQKPEWLKREIGPKHMREVGDALVIRSDKLRNEVKSMKRKYNVYTQNSWGAEKFYIEDENQDKMIFEARSEEHAIFQAAEYIRETSMYDADTTEGWINMQNWYAEEV